MNPIRSMGAVRTFSSSYRRESGYGSWKMYTSSAPTAACTTMEMKNAADERRFTRWLLPVPESLS
jgi:hypothetical protein